MKKISAVFHFSEEYRDNYTRQEVTVKLFVDYNLKNFSITPAWGGGDKFQFTETSHQYKKWVAVLNCIQKAIERGNIEIGVTEEKLKA